MQYTFRKILASALLLTLALALVGCVCGQKTASTGPENPTFTVVADRAETAAVLAYFQAHTGYKPTVVLADDAAIEAAREALAAENAPAERADALKKLAEGATCLLLTDEAMLAEFDALGFKADNEALRNLTDSYRIENAGRFGISIAQMPAGSEINADALKALAAWLTGAEAKYLSDNPDLLK